MKKVTKKQTILLFGALCLLVITVFAMYIALPMLSEIGQADEDYENAKNKLANMKTEASLLPVYLTENEELIVELNEKLGEFYEEKSNSWIDSYLLAIIEGCGCKASSLGIADPVMIEDSPLFPEDAAAGYDEDETDAVTSESGVYVVNAVYNITASYPQLLKTIEALGKEKSVAIGGINFSQSLIVSVGSTGEIYSPSTGMTVTGGAETVKKELGEELECQLSVYVLTHKEYIPEDLGIEEDEDSDDEDDEDNDENGEDEDSGSESDEDGTNED